MLKKILNPIINLYSWKIAQTCVIALREHGSSPTKFLKWFWTTKTYRTRYNVYWEQDKPLVLLLLAGMDGIVVSGVWLLYIWAIKGVDGYWAFGLAMLAIYPVAIAHVLALGVWLKRAIWFLAHPKKLGKSVLSTILEAQVHSLRRRHKFTIVAVAGSVGKTSTKLAVANLLGQSLRVLHQTGNYNDRLTVPLILFNQVEPKLWNVFGWLKLIGENTASISHPYPYDVVVVELGTDGPGQMAEFAYLKPDITVLTAISPEHMEFFPSLDAVASEELTVFDYSKRVLVNADDIAGKYLAGRDFQEYSLVTNAAHNFYAKPSNLSLQGQDIHIEFPSGKQLSAKIQYVGQQGAKFAVAAAAVADMLNVSHADITAGLQRLEAFVGRMQILEGIKDSVLIDDTYNASPIAVEAALDVLYAQKAAQRIAILGSMNELGQHAHAAHVEVGEYCNPKKLDILVTIGADAEKWLAPAAKRAGCTVHSFKSPQQAGRFVAEHLKTGAVVLAKGSQNGVFAEEALKELLAHPADSAKLVRQTPSWLRKKAQQFS